MPSNVDVLMEMGFPQNRAEKALARTNYKGVQEAMDWLFNHSEDPDIDDPFEAPKGNVCSEPAASSGITDEIPVPSTEAAGEGAGAEEGEGAGSSKSLKCDECGKQLRTELAMQTHAAKTGHTSFSESTEEVKPLTEEEKAKQMELVQEKLKRKKLEREEKDRLEAKEREKLRRTQGKDISVAKFEMEQKELKLLAEQKRREKADDKAAKQRALDDIRRDKEARVAARAAAKGEAPAPAPIPAPRSLPAAAPAAKKEYTECKLQIRLPSGQPLTNTFKANESLSAVRLYVTMSAPEAPPGFTFMTTFPRRVYSDEDMDKPLSSLGLVPSAVIMVTKQ